MSQPTATVNADVFRDVISNLVSGVSVITTQRGEERFGVTVSSVTSLSLEPASILVCLNQRLSITEVIDETGVFAVNILGKEQGDLASQFAVRHEDKFRDVNVSVDGMGNPILSDALAHLECRLVSKENFGTHHILIAVIESATSRSGEPLAYFRSSFGRFENDEN